MSEPSSGPGRHEARERAFGLLYQRELRETDSQALLDSLPLQPDAYACAIVLGVDREHARIDELIEGHSDGWPVHRMPSLDRTILRLATWELLASPDVPRAVVINEAVELTKEYSTERSPAFVNGVLDAVATEVRG